MNIQDLINFTLESCRFSKSSYTFEFCGQFNSEYRTLLVSTSYFFSRAGENYTDAGERFSLEVWGFIEKKVTSVSVDENKKSPKIIFNFEGGLRFLVWSDEPLIDNLLIVTNPETGDWFPVL